MVLTIIALLIFVFNTYVSVFLKMLHRTPIIKGDWLFVKENAGIYSGYFLIISIIFIILLGILGITFYYLNSLYIDVDTNIYFILGVLIFVALLGLYNTQVFTINDYFSRTVISLIIFIQKSRKQTMSYEKLYSLSTEEVKSLNPFSDVVLKEKPNIHIISMESYGSILFRDSQNFESSSNLVSEWSERMKKTNIKCCTSFAVPPHFASGTMFSYSTLLFGMKIENSYKLNILFNEMPNFEAYQSLFRFSKKEGYTNFLLQGMIGDFEGTVNFDQLKKNLTYDKLFLGPDLDYKGKRLKFMSLQECPPDQFTLNKALDIAKKQQKPYTLFNCTLNSHFDFHSPLKRVDDWRKLDDSNFNFETTMDKNWSRVEKYKKAINYTIDTVFDIIKTRMSENDIYIVYGDHQPTLIADEKYGKETPIHIFSHNSEFINLWNEYGFTEGLCPKESEHPIKFEAFYSAFMRSLNKIYGVDKELKLPFNNCGAKML